MGIVETDGSGRPDCSCRSGHATAGFCFASPPESRDYPSRIPIDLSEWFAVSLTNADLLSRTLSSRSLSGMCSLHARRENDRRQHQKCACNVPEEMDVPLVDSQCIGLRACFTPD